MRFREHLEGNGSAWTRKYKPIIIERVIPRCSPFDEDKYVKEYMAKYGIDNVRGGSYVQDTLNETQVKGLRTEIWAAMNCCTRCGRDTHYVKDCKATTDYDGNPIVQQNMQIIPRSVNFQRINHPFSMQPQNFGGNIPNIPSNMTCFRCGRSGHWQNSCFARSDINGHPLSSSDDDSSSEDDYY